MRALLASIMITGPLLLFSGAAKAYPWSYSSYSSPTMSNYSLNGPGYSGSGYAMSMGRNGGYATYSDNYGTTSCYGIVSFVSCY
jgi:hypothetical protein